MEGEEEIVMKMKKKVMNTASKSFLSILNEKKIEPNF